MDAPVEVALEQFVSGKKSREEGREQQLTRRWGVCSSWARAGEAVAAVVQSWRSVLVGSIWVVIVIIVIENLKS